MSRNKPRVVCMLLCLLLLVGCAADRSESSQAKILAEPPKTSQAVKYRTVDAEKKSYSQSISGDALLYPIQQAVRIQADNVRFERLCVRSGELVEKGDVIATFTKQSDSIRLEEIRLEINRLNEGLENSLQATQRSIDELSLQLDAAHAPGAQNGSDIIEKRIRILELQKDLDRLNTEQQISTLKKERKKLEESEGSEEVCAPITGYVSNISYIREGIECHAGQLLCTMYKAEECLFSVGNSMNKLRMGMEVTLEYGKKNDRKSAKARIVSASNCLPPSLASDKAYLVLDMQENSGVTDSISDALANATTVLDPNVMLTPVVRADVLHLDDALLLPRHALENENNKYVVSILENGSTHKRYVEIALTGLDIVWILDGVSEGQTVILE